MLIYGVDGLYDMQESVDIHLDPLDETVESNHEDNPQALY